MSASGTKRTCRDDLLFVRFWGKADVGCESALMVLASFDPKRTKAGLKSRSAPCLCVLSFGWQHTRGQQHPIRFRTIQVRPKDLPAVLRQPECAVNRASLAPVAQTPPDRGGSPHVQP